MSATLKTALFPLWMKIYHANMINFQAVSLAKSMCYFQKIHIFFNGGSVQAIGEAGQIKSFSNLFHIVTRE